MDGKMQLSHLEVKKTPREQLAEKLWEHVEQNPYYRSDSFVVDKNTIIRLAAIAEDFFRKSFKESIDSERAIADRYLDALKKYGRCQSTCDSFWMKPCSCGFTKAVGESNG